MSKHSTDERNDIELAFKFTDADLVFDQHSVGPYMVKVQHVDGTHIWYGPRGLVDAEKLARRQIRSGNQAGLYTRNAFNEA